MDNSTLHRGENPEVDTPYSHVVWDWNGTLLDDIATSISAINSVLASRNLSTLDSIADYQEVFCFPISKYYENLGFDFALESFDSLAQAYVRDYDARVNTCSLFPQAPQVLEGIQRRGLTQIVLSASERGRLGNQIDERNVAHYFEEYLGLNDCYANTKVDIGHQWLVRQNGNVHRALMVGDTLHDHEVASRLGFDCVLVSTGHQSRDVLESSGCPVLEDVSEVLTFIGD